MQFLFVLLLFCLSSLSVVNAENSLELTPKEIEELNKFSKSIPVDKGVGQFFMINLPINYVDSFNRLDWTNKKGGKFQSPIHKKLIEEGFGSILLQRTNFQHLNKVSEVEEERISLIATFIRNLQYKAISKKNKGINIPLFIAVDFEGPIVNSIRNTLITPPPALTLATSQNKEFIEETGKIIGYQLSNSGINMLLGPVLDIDKTPQGDYNTILLNRSFSSHADGVIVVAYYYIKGLREAGVTVIGKHFPGLGFVKGNPHKEIVPFLGDRNDLKEHLKPYNELKPLLNGIMTSHVSLPFLNNKKPATFNKSIIQFIRDQSLTEAPSLKALNYNHKLVLTDDLGMQAITSYAKGNYASMTIQAIESGHDIVMFAKVLADNEKKKAGGIYIDELIKVKEKLANYLKRPENKKKYYISLQRIIRAKATSYKLHGGNIDQFISKKKNKVIRSQLSAPNSVKGEDGFIDYLKVKKSYEKIIEASYLLLSGSYSHPVDDSNNICIFSPKNYNNTYRGVIGLYEDKFHISNEIHSGGNSLNENIKHIKNYIKENSCDIVFHVINSKFSTDRASNIIKSLKNRSKEKEMKVHLVLLLHQSPTSLPKEIINNKNITIMGAFTDHELSYSVDVKIIKGDIKPNNITSLTINYNNEKFKFLMKKPSINEIKFDYTLFDSLQKKYITSNNISKKKIIIIHPDLEEIIIYPQFNSILRGITTIGKERKEKILINKILAKEITKKINKKIQSDSIHEYMLLAAVFLLIIALLFNVFVLNRKQGRISTRKY
jgi:beta-N-acetylhexosaminidase